MVEAELAVIAFLLNLREIFRGEFGHVAFVIINPIQQCGEGRT